MSDEEDNIEAAAEESLLRIQEFDPQRLVRRDELGTKFAFDSAVEPAQRLISLYRKLPPSSLGEYPDQQLNVIRQEADSDFNRLEEILNFDPQEADASSRKDQLTDGLSQRYQKAFNTLYPLISFAVARTVDFNSLEENGRAAVQSVRDESKKVFSELEETSKQAERVLEDVREAAAEHGVTQEARYFAEEYLAHSEASKNWLWATCLVASVVFLYSVLTFFMPQYPLFRAENTVEALQIVASKILVFFVLAYALFQCVRNYSAHRHNAVVNKHRQNALMTYTTLTAASITQEARDSVLQHAAAAIYAPNDSGYQRNEERGYGMSSPVVSLSPSGFGGGSSAG